MYRIIMIPRNKTFASSIYIYLYIHISLAIGAKNHRLIYSNRFPLLITIDNLRYKEREAVISNPNLTQTQISQKPLLFLDFGHGSYLKKLQII